MLQNIYIQIMSNPRLDLVVRQNIFRNSPPEVIGPTYTRIATNVRQQLPEGIDIGQVFPLPPGVEVIGPAGEDAAQDPAS